MIINTQFYTNIVRALVEHHRAESEHLKLAMAT